MAQVDKTIEISIDLFCNIIILHRFTDITNYSGLAIIRQQRIGDILRTGVK